MAQDISEEEHWRLFLTGGHPQIESARRWFRRLPTDPRCKVCSAPFRGLGARLVRGRGFVPWEKNPNVCRRCVSVFDGFEVRGAEVEVTLLFADVRGSTALASTMSPTEYSSHLNNFYAAATEVLIGSDALLDKFVGDEAIGLYLPGIAGDEHAHLAVAAALALLRATGHDADPWMPIGVGVHTGIAFVGQISEGRTRDFTALGDSVNLAARLGSAAAAGEVLVTLPTIAAASVNAGLERRSLELKGIADPVEVGVLTLDTAHLAT